MARKELRNPGFDDRWTCPECHEDHHRPVTYCDGCGAPLSCTVEHDPVAVCAVRLPEDDEDDEPEHFNAVT